MADTAAPSQATRRPDSPGSFLERMLEVGGGAVSYSSSAAPVHGLSDIFGPPVASMGEPLAHAAAWQRQGGAFEAQPAGGGNLSSLSADDSWHPTVQVPLRSTSDPTQRTPGFTAQQQPRAMHRQLQDMSGYQQAAAAPPPLPPVMAAPTGSSSSLGNEAYAAYLDAAVQQYQHPPPFVPGMGLPRPQFDGLGLAAGGLSGLSTPALGAHSLHALPSCNAAPQHATATFHGNAGYGSMSHSGSGSRGGLPPEPRPDQPPPAAGHTHGWGHAAQAPQQLLQQYMQAAATPLPDSSVRSQLWPLSMSGGGGSVFGSGYPGSLDPDAAHNDSASMSVTSEGSHESAPGQPLRSSLGSWRSPLDAAQAAEGFLHPLPGSRPKGQPGAGADLSNFAAALHLPAPPQVLRR